MRIIYIVTGLLVSLYGAWYILMVYAHSTMTDPTLPEAARAAEQRQLIIGKAPRSDLELC